MYHQHDEFVTPIPPSGKGRGVMVAPPTIPPPGSNNTGTMSSTGSSNSDAVKFVVPAGPAKDYMGGGENKENNKELATPSSTPTTSRKSRRRSNLFTPSKKSNPTGMLSVKGCVIYNCKLRDCSDTINFDY
jgi:hypothetical protein